jgi:hypothetical protein
MFGPKIRKLHRSALLLGAASMFLAGVPMSLAPGILPSASPGGPMWWPDGGSFGGATGDLPQFIAVLQQSFERLMQWIQMFQQTVSDTLTRMVWESPGQLPDEADLKGLIAQINVLPATLRGTLQAVLGKLQAAVVPGTIDQRHHAYIESNPEMVHEAIGITEVDQVVAGGTVQQAAASQATAAGAAAVSRDLRPEIAGADAQATNDALTSAAQNLPSSRAGIELLIAGMGAGLRQQATLQGTTADRLTVLVQQTAQVSQQVGALAATTGALTLRQAERDRNALNGQLGLADAVSTVGQVLQDVLSGAGDSSVNEPRLEPLY